jgi:membrane protein DedA with SNARE-associated domain
MLHELIKIWFGWVETWGYLGVFVLMALESTVVPVPSEIVMPPAAFWAAQGRMSFTGVILAGTLGSYVGSVINYTVSKAVGKPLVQRYGRYFLVSPEKLEMSQSWVRQFGMPGIFAARLLSGRDTGNAFRQIQPGDDRGLRPLVLRFVLVRGAGDRE